MPSEKPKDVDPSEAQARALRRNCAKMGATIADLKAERRVVAQAGDAAPAAQLARILVQQGRRPRPPPEKRGPPPRTEAQRILAEQPQTSAQVIGHHKTPAVAKPEPKPAAAPLGTALAKATESREFRKIFPNSSSREYGFHHQFAGGRIARIDNAMSMAKNATTEQVVADPLLADALASLRSRVLQLETKGLKTKII